MPVELPSVSVQTCALFIVAGDLWFEQVHRFLQHSGDGLLIASLLSLSNLQGGFGLRGDGGDAGGQDCIPGYDCLNVGPLQYCQRAAGSSGGGRECRDDRFAEDLQPLSHGGRGGHGWRGFDERRLHGVPSGSGKLQTFKADQGEPSGLPFKLIPPPFRTFPRIVAKGCFVV